MIDEVEPLAWEPLRTRTVGPLVSWFSLKLRRTVVLDGELESDCALLLEVDPTIMRWCEHAYKAIAEIDGCMHYSIVDLLAERRTGVFALEVKYQADIDDPTADTARQFMVQRLDAERRGLAYSKVSELVVRRSPLFIANCKTLMTWARAGGGDPQNAGVSALRATLDRHGRLELDRLYSLAELPNGVFHQALAAAILGGSIAADMECGPFTRFTGIWRHENELENHPNAFRCEHISR